MNHRAVEAHMRLFSHQYPAAFTQLTPQQGLYSFILQRFTFFYYIYIYIFIISYSTLFLFELICTRSQAKTQEKQKWSYGLHQEEKAQC